MRNKTFDIYFNDGEDSNNKGFKESFDYCKNYIAAKYDDYFKDYEGGSVSIVCNETSEVVFEQEIN